MYHAPFDTLTRLGWVLAAVVTVLLATRAVRVERRSTAPARTRTVRLLDGGLSAAATVAVLGFLAVLVSIVWGTLISWG